MKNDDEMYQSLLSRYHAYQEKQKTRNRVFAATVPLVLCICAAAVTGLRPANRTEPIPSVLQQSVTETAAAQTAALAATAGEQQPATESLPQTEQPATTPAVQSGETEPSAADLQQTASSAEPVNTSGIAAEVTASKQTETQTTAAPPVQTAPKTQTVPSATVAPPPPATAATQTTAAPVPANPGTPGAVYTKVAVSYEEAKERFAHPIVPCVRDDYIGCRVGIVSQNGNVSSDAVCCLSVIYAFTDGTLTLTDQDRMAGSSSPWNAAAYAYSGRTFYVRADESYDRIYVEYYPTAESGIFYFADFAGGTDIYALMDLIIELEVP